MLDEATNEVGAQHGLDFASFYGLGRASILGDAPPDVVASAYPFIPAELVAAIWPASVEKLAPSLAVEAYGGACRDWGRRNLAGFEGLDRLTELTQRITDAAPGYYGPLFAGWRAVPLPDDAPGRAAQLLHVARELRGGMHVIAMLACGLTPLEAVMVAEGAESAAQYFWPEPYPDPEPFRAQHDEAQTLTNEIFGRASEVLTSDERTELAGILKSALAHIGG